MEEPSTLRTAIERTIRARICTDIQPFFRELFFLMRHSEAGICRNPELYLEIAQKVLRVEYNVSDDDRLILKYVRKSERNVEEPTIDKTAVTLIRTLLDKLVEPDEYLMKTYSETAAPESTAKEAQSTTLQNKLFAADLDTFTSVLANKKPTENKEKEKKETTEEKKPKKLLSKSEILSVLTDAVKSYVGYSKLIMDQVFEVDPNNPILTEDMTAVRFILEKFVLLPGVDKESLEMASEARLLLGAVGACNHSTTIQLALVMEVKNCIQRIVNSHYEDTKEKYNDVCCILSLISDMMAMCPPVNWLSIVNNSVVKMKNNVAHLSNISKLFTRKGLISELARLPHNLDLSNPNFVFAMNAALKPLETLTKLANDPGCRSHGMDTSTKANSRHSTTSRPVQESGTDPTMTNSSGTTSGNTNAQGEETNEDTENTENDLSAAAESLEPASDGQVNDDITDIGEIVLEDQNMDRDTDRGSSMHMDEIVIPPDRVPVENDDLPNSMTLQTALMQMTSEMVHGLITELQPSNQEQLTDPDDPDNLEEDQYGDEQMEEDNNEVDEGGYNNENDDPDDDFLMDPSVFSRPEPIMNDLFFVEYPGNDGETLGSFNELYGDDPTIRHEEPAVQNPPPVHHPLLMRRNREEPAPARNPRSRPRRYQLLQFNPRSHSTHRPDLLQNLLFSRRHFRAVDYRQGNDQESQNSGNYSFRGGNLILMDNGFGMLTRADEENIDLLDQSMAHYFGHHLSTNMQSVCYVRWASEMKILDADSAAMAATVLSYRLRPTLEMYREEEAKAKNTNQSPAMDVSSPPSSTETNKNVEMTEVPQSSLETNAIDVLMHLPHQATATGDNQNVTRTESEPSQEAEPLPAENDANAENRVNVEERSDGAAARMPEATESNEDSNPRDSFTPYFMFDEEHEGRPSFQGQGNSEEMAEEEESCEQLVTIDMNAPSQEVEGDISFLCWGNRSRSDINLPLRRVSGSIRITPTTVPPAVYPLMSSPTLLEVTQSSETSTSDSQCETQTPPAPLSNDSGDTSIFRQNTTVTQDVSNNDTLQPSDADTTETETTANRTPQQFPDFLPSMFGQNAENRERSPTPTQPPAPFPESESTPAANAEGEPSTAAASSNDIAEDASPVPLDAEEMIQLYPNGRATYRGISIPAGLDPSFLAALPSDMREEVFSNHLRQQSLQRGDLARESTTPPSSTAPDEVNPEFLAALPLNIQEEVLAQQRQERQRQVAASANPNDPFDAAAFFQNLPSSLRQSILADIEESQISVLPPDLAAEAQNLRREHDARNRHYFQERERVLAHNTLSSILRGTGSRGTRVAIHPVPTIRSPWDIPPLSRPNDNNRMELSSETTGRQLLDQEAVSTLLVLLFVQDFRLNINRLHRVITNLCCHPPTRDFVIRTLISIMEKCNESRSNAVVSSPRQTSPKRKIPRSSFYAQSCTSGEPEIVNQSTDPAPTWLNLSMDAALGCRVNVFQVQLKRYGKRSVDNYVAHSVSIHPQAAPIVVRKAMDLLFTLTKVFQNEFLPKKSKEADKSCEISAGKRQIVTPFWDILVRLENLNSGKFSKKGKSALKSLTSTPFSEVEPRASSFDRSLMGHLVTMLTCPLIKSSTELTDKLLHILNLISDGFTEINEEEAVPVTEEHLKIIVNVLTSNGCTENGLEQATNLLIRMSNCPDPTRITSLKLLISGAREVASLVKEHIEALLQELKEANAKAKSDAELEVELKENHRKGQIQDRFTKKSVVITAPSKVKGGFDIQLPAMQPLISKTSSQSFFLRILKVIIQLREVLVFRRRMEGKKNIGEKDKRMGSGRSGSTASASGEPDAASRSRLVNPGGLGDSEDTQPTQLSLYQSPNEDNDDGARSATSSMSVDIEVVDGSSQYMEGSVVMEDTNEQTVIESQPEGSSAAPSDSRQRKTSESDVTMDTDSERDSKAAEPSEKEESSEQFPSLTKQLQLDDLWISLSECLTELEKTPDHQAALILQPAVEAFFLVHSTAINECRVLMPSGNTPTSTPRRGRTDGPPALMPIFPTPFSFGFGDLPRRSQQSNFLVSVTASDVLSGNAQGSRHVNSQNSRPGQNQSFGYIISEYRRFIQASGASSSSPLALDADSEANPETSTSQASQPVSEINSSTSLATFFKQTESSPLLDPFKFLRFAELHRAVLNQILRQSTTHLADGPFAILVNFTRVLDFDVKRKYFRRELEKMDDGSRRGDETTVNVNRSHVFEESFRELHRKSPEEWKNKFYVAFESEEGQDAGGLLREWYMIISREIFNPDYALFTVSPGDRVTYTINPSSHCNPNHLLYFKFVGRLIAKAIYDSKYLECYFTRSFYKHILGVPVKYQDMESEDPEFYEGLVYLKNHKISDLGNDLTFTTDVQEFGVTETRELKPNGANIPVTDENKMDYIHLVCQMKMTGAIRKQLDAFLEGFYEIIPKQLISIFNEQELELLISGLPNIDIDDLKNNTEYTKYSRNSMQIVWFWRALREMDSQDQAKFLQFVTGTSKVPLQGFAALEGMNGIQKFQIHRDDRSTDRLPSAHTCFNQLDLPAYETYTKLKNNLLKAIHECSEGFGFA
ncbi:UNVERIFIED_CONTAM: hypothetical protein PYX00_009908 [Menopon gallinae]|uniref:HECT-type E3 ubiquitin transferase n=1 Tax=Menopon gallinae TaxID=328185 RepID=A0AAW2HDK3_9NEOP